MAYIGYPLDKWLSEYKAESLTVDHSGWVTCLEIAMLPERQILYFVDFEKRVGVLQLLKN